tara:strand:- start:1315 stop:1563 length:249 start_codon:yes stop_codon:yes gene_type:complete
VDIMVEIARKNDDGVWDSNIVGVLGERIHSFSLNNLLEAIYHKENIREFNVNLEDGIISVKKKFIINKPIEWWKDENFELPT